MGEQGNQVRQSMIAAWARAPLLLAAGLLAGCGGGAGAGATDATPTPAASSTAPSPSAGDGTRPEGRWTLVAWTVKRSDEDRSAQLARTILASFEPSCPSGPCDVTMSPAGHNGTYREAESPYPEGHTPNTDPWVLAWDGTAYTAKREPSTSSCTPQVGKQVAKGYTVTSTMTLTFVPAEGGTTARVHGTITHDNKGTKAGKAEGCTDYVESEVYGGVPTGSLAADTPLAGTYEGSLSSTGSTPKALAPAGTQLTLGAMRVAGTAEAPTLTGIPGAAAPLTRGTGGWSGTTPTGTMDCSAADGSGSTGGADGTEEFTDLHAVALTDDGEPIFAGGYRLRSNPNATGLKASCSLAVWEGRILLVPEGAGR